MPVDLPGIGEDMGAGRLHSGSSWRCGPRGLESPGGCHQLGDLEQLLFKGLPGEDLAHGGGHGWGEVCLLRGQEIMTCYRQL